MALDSWTFSRTFSGATPEVAELREEAMAVLRLRGVDTFAEVTLNGHHLLSANNFHRRGARLRCRCQHRRHASWSRARPLACVLAYVRACVRLPHPTLHVRVPPVCAGRGSCP